MSAERVMVFERSCISTSLVWLSRMKLSCTCSQPAEMMRREAAQPTSVQLAGSSTKPGTVLGSLWLRICNIIQTDFQLG